VIDMKEKLLFFLSLFATGMLEAFRMQFI